MPEDKLICGNCGAELTTAARACPKCGSDPRKAVKFCTVCGEPITNPNAIMCTKCGASLKGSAAARGGGGAHGEMDPILATVISLIIPGLGLYFVWPEDKKTMAILYTVVLLAADAVTVVVGIILSFFLIGLCCFFLIPVIHLGAALYTYNEAMKVTGGKTLF
ncbi:MAG: Double zinc ribbon [Methanocella sp. PtaU1.Bin125]|nr:MAG: Double zinc ribbon [Methanocella sp. PtaU1.Bin125]